MSWENFTVAAVGAAYLAVLAGVVLFDLRERRLSRKPSEPETPADPPRPVPRIHFGYGRIEDDRVTERGVALRRRGAVRGHGRSGPPARRAVPPMKGHRTGDGYKKSRKQHRRDRKYARRIAKGRRNPTHSPHPKPKLPKEEA